MNSNAFDTIPVALCVVKRDRKALTCLYANKAMGILAGADVTGKTLEEAIPGKDCDTFARRLKTPTPPDEATISFERDGEAHWILVSVSEERYEGQDCFALWITDISASKKAEAALKQAIGEADAAAAQKSNFLATISHEIRSPMQSVYGLLEMIELEKPSDSILNMTQTARGAASGLLEILDDVLDFAKMDADQMELDNFEVPLRTLVRGLIEAMAVKVQGKSVALKDDIAPDVPFVIAGDPKRLRQIIINLMSNALKFTREGSVTVRVSKDVKHLARPSRGIALRFEVTDTGIGMSEDVASRLFKPFVQADNSTSRKYGGTGLGLSICRKLAELMGGVIGVDSVPGEGSTFWFEIPTEEVATDSTVLDLPSLDGLSVLSVEDHPLGAKEIVKSLKSMGAMVESCATVAEAIELVKRRPFDVGVIDQGLPDGLGLDLIREIMRVRPFMGLVMYTVRDDAGLQHSLQSLGVDYLSKPASRIGLGEAVRNAASKAVKLPQDNERNLLIAEDTPAVREVLVRQLEVLSVKATFVENGREALFAVRSGEYSVLITDLHMPEMDGYALVKAVREDDVSLGRHMPVIALTADVQIAQRQVYMGHGFDECILKPVSLGQMRRLLIRWGFLGADSVEPVRTSPAPSPQSLSAIDREAMIEQMGAFDDDAIEMLKMFIDMTSPLMDRLSKAADANDLHDLKEAAHSLKGAARSACLNALGDVAAYIQDDAEDGRFSPEMIVQAQSEFRRAQLEIAAL